MSLQIKKRSSVAKSFYIDNDTIQKLSEQSKQEGISVNALVNKILKNHTDLQYPATKYPSVVLSDELVRRLLERDEDLFLLFGREMGQKIFKESILQERMPRNLLSFKNILKGFCEYGQWAKYEEHIAGGKLIVSLSHDLGEKWSKCMREYFYSGLREIIGQDYPPEDVFTIVGTGLMITLPSSIIEDEE
jgi:hypothetical protein